MRQAIRQSEQDEERDVVVDARKALSAVARLKGEWGAQMTAAVLGGSSRKRIVEAGLDELSVYGILDDLTQRKIVAMLEALIDGGLVVRRGKWRTLELTALGTGVMLGKRELGGEVRRTLEEAQKVVECYDPAARYDLDSPTIQETLRLLRSGRSPRMIAQIRGFAESTIADHVLVLAAYGQHFDLTPHLDVELLEELREVAAGWKPGDPLTPVREALSEEECEWAQLKLHLVQVYRE